MRVTGSFGMTSFAFRLLPSEDFLALIPKGDDDISTECANQD
jgi:hypothetical protein